MRVLELFVGCYGKDVSTSIHWLRYHTETNEFKEVAATAGVENPSYVAVNTDRNRLYAISEVANGEVVSFQIDRDKERLVELNRKPTKGAPCYVEINQEKGMLLTANYGNGSIIAHDIKEDGTIGEILDYVAFPDIESNKLSRIHTIRRVRDTSFYIATDIGQSKLRIFELKDSGKLKPVQIIDLPRDCGPREITFHARINVFYIVNEYRNTVLVYRYGDNMKNIELIQVLPTVPVSYEGENYGAAIEMNDALNRVHVSNRGHHSILAFEVQSEGKLKNKGWIELEGEWPRHFTTLPDNSGIFVANEHSNELTVIRWTETSAIVCYRQYKIKQPVCVKVY